MTKILPITLLVALTACQGATLSTPSPGLPAAPLDRVAFNHLYMAVSTASHHASIQRFRLLDGVPESAPDRVYDGYSGWLAISPDGTLYVVEAGMQILAFPRDATKPARTINVPGPGDCGVSSGETVALNGAATDPSGNVFASVYTYAQRAGKRQNVALLGKGGVPCEGVVIYGPNANGRQRPMARIAGRDAIFGNLAVDASENLYVCQYSQVVEYTSALTNPQQGRVFSGEYAGRPRSVATDTQGNLFIGNLGASYESGWIDRYASDASGGGPPASRVELQDQKVYFLDSIGVRNGNLYVDENDGGVTLYHARKNGEQSPFASLAGSNVISVAVGP
jgi:hypothetical protein